MHEITRNVANIFSFYAIMAIEHGFFNALTFARSLGRCWKPRPPASVFNTSHGTWRMLMHEKTCFVPILRIQLMQTKHMFVIGSCITLRAKFRASKTEVSQQLFFFYWPFQDGSSFAVLLCTYIDGFILDICFIIVCSSYLLLSVLQEDCATMALPVYLHLYMYSRLS